MAVFLDRLKCVQGFVDGQLKPSAVATRLGVTTRQVRRLVRRYEQHGPTAKSAATRNFPDFHITPCAPNAIPAISVKLCKWRGRSWYRDLKSRSGPRSHIQKNVIVAFQRAFRCGRHPLV